MTSSTKSMAAAKGADHQQLMKRVTWVVALGVLLDPLNSSMIAVALLKIGADFGIGITTVTWLVSSFYLAATVGQPLMGKLADLFGSRRVFSIGMPRHLQRSLDNLANIMMKHWKFSIDSRALRAAGMVKSAAKLLSR